MVRWVGRLQLAVVYGEGNHADTCKSVFYLNTTHPFDTY